jgi:hypothetical protein
MGNMHKPTLITEIHLKSGKTVTIWDGDVFNEDNPMTDENVARATQTQFDWWTNNRQPTDWVADYGSTQWGTGSMAVHIQVDSIAGIEVHAINAHWVDEEPATPQQEMGTPDPELVADAD